MPYPYAPIPRKPGAAALPGSGIQLPPPPFQQNFGVQTTRTAAALPGKNAQTTANRAMTGGVAMNDPRIALEKNYKDLIGSYDSGLKTQLAGIDAVGAADRRRAATLSGIAGRSFGGGLLSGQRQASLGQMRMTNEAISGNETKKREAQMALLKEKLGDVRRGEDREFEREMMNSGQAHDIELLRLQAQLNPTPGVPGSGGGGLGGTSLSAIASSAPGAINAAFNPPLMGGQSDGPVSEGLGSLMTEDKKKKKKK